MVLFFVFEGVPISKDNYKNSVPVKKNSKWVCIPRLADFYKLYEESIKEEAIRQMKNQGVETPFLGKITVCKLDFYFDRKPTVYDFFNFGKSLFDSLNGTVYKDDNQIIGFSGIGTKSVDKDNPRIELILDCE